MHHHHPKTRSTPRDSRSQASRHMPENATSSQLSAVLPQGYALPSSFGLESLHPSELTSSTEQLGYRSKSRGLALALVGSLVGVSIYWLTPSAEGDHSIGSGFEASTHGAPAIPSLPRQLPHQDKGSGAAASKTTVDHDKDHLSLAKSTSGGRQRQASHPAAKPPSAAARATAVQPLRQVGYFAYNKATLSPKTRAMLDTWAVHLAQDKKITLVLEGHCDEKGSAAYNDKLGHERAAAAKAYLVKKGVDKRRLKTISYGKSRPASTGLAAAQRGQNRRIELRTSELVSSR